MPTILGVSGSPIPNSNTDRAVRFVLDETGLDSEFVKLSTQRIEPCRACLACVETNQCVIKDDGQALAHVFDQARAVVVGGFTPYSSLDARTKAFMERMYCLRHKAGKSVGKVGAGVITTACPPGAEGLPPASDLASQQLGIWMMEEGVENAGNLVIIGNVPCIRCGFGDTCEMSGIQMMGGPGATVESMGVSTFGEPPGGKDGEAAKDLARRIRAAVDQA
ncbi:MAG: flavodoxin family protein [Armatimonadia bacterium]|nr:flavodoxin family protein [Armatimonadia bacterium]